MELAPRTHQRITLIDALRALALLGILVVHTHDHYNLYVPTLTFNNQWEWLNTASDWIYQEFFLSKAYLLFSFLFGLSFFIQIDNGKKRGENVRSRFLWRLALLFIIGVFHTLFYAGDILTSFAILGVWLLLLERIPSWIILIIASLCLLRLPLLIDVLQGEDTGSMTNGWGITGAPTREWVYEHGTWTQAALWDLGSGMLDKVGYCIYSGRYWQMLGLFPLGMLAGRIKLFTYNERLKKRMVFLLWTGAIGWLSLRWTPEFMGCSAWQIDLFTSYANIAFLGFSIGSFTLILNHLRDHRIMPWLSSTGRMTLTCYLLQTLVFTSLFFGWGLGLARDMGPALCLLATILFSILQAILCKIWMSHFRFGPMEWAWRSATLLKPQAFRRNEKP